MPLARADAKRQSLVSCEAEQASERPVIHHSRHSLLEQGTLWRRTPFQKQLA